MTSRKGSEYLAPAPRDRTLVLVAALLGVLLLMGMLCVGLALALPESSEPAATVTIVLGIIGTTTTTIVTAIVTGRNAERTQRVEEGVDEIRNGLMDAKIRAGVHAVLDEREGRQHHDKQ